MKLPTETDETNHYTVPGFVVCFTILQALRSLALGLTAWMASIIVEHTTAPGLYSHVAHKATCNIRTQRLHGETATS